MEAVEPTLRKFLRDAKRNTYAAEGGAQCVKALLDGSRQLEFRQGPFLYRDIYFGTAFFSGIETVSVPEGPLWTMAYAGGIRDPIDDYQVQDVYRFLREALRTCPVSNPYRGAEEFQNGEFRYDNHHQGQIDRFSGSERITWRHQEVYTLSYAGGFLK
jgi:hypothetical protein